MANIFDTLPTAVNAAGAGVDVSATGTQKTLAIDGTFDGILYLEASQDAGATWFPVQGFTKTGKYPVLVVAQQLRIRSQGANPALVPFTADVNFGANDDGALFASIPAPAANASGVPVDVSALGTFTTWIITGTFGDGVVDIEISEDGVDYLVCKTLAAPGLFSRDAIADWMRATSRGALNPAGVAPVITVGATKDAITTGGFSSTPNSNCFVYRPGSGTTGPVVFESWATLYAALDAARALSPDGGCWEIHFDDGTLSPAVIPAGAYDMSGVTWMANEGSGAGGWTAVTVSDGAVFSGLRSLEGLLAISFTGATAPVSDLRDGDFFVAKNGVLLFRIAGAAPFFDLTTLAGGERMRFVLGDLVVFGDGTDALISQPTATSEVFFIMGPGVTIATEALVGDVTAVQRFTMNSNSAIVENQPTGVGDALMVPGPLAERWKIALQTVGSIVSPAVPGVAYVCDPSGGVITIDLPIVTQYNAGTVILVKNASNGVDPINITPNGAQTLDGVAGVTSITTPRESLKMMAYVVSGVGAWAII